MNNFSHFLDKLFSMPCGKSFLPATNEPVVIYFLFVTRIIESIIESSKLAIFLFE